MHVFVCQVDVILIVMKWILAQVLGINFAGTYWYLVRFSVSHSMLLLLQKSSPCLFTNVQLFGLVKFENLK